MTILGAVTKRLGDDTPIGACTVLDAETARRCFDAGARFTVSPSIDVPGILQMSIRALRRLRGGSARGALVSRLLVNNAS